MTEIIRCDGCGHELVRAGTAWLRLEAGGIDMRTYESWWHKLPLHFCDARCVLGYFTKTLEPHE